MVGMTCPDCSGTGKITLFTSAKPCKACGGTGKVGPKVEVDDMPQVDATGYSYVTYHVTGGKRYMSVMHTPKPSETPIL
jgi:DnaJ-class molecular chaperone